MEEKEMFEENLNEKTVVLGIFFDMESCYVGAEVGYSEFDKGQSLSDYPSLCYPVGVDSIKISEWHEHSAMERVLDALNQLLSLKDIFLETKQLYIRFDCDDYFNLKCSRVDDLLKVIKESVTDKRLTNTKIDYL